MNAEGMTILAGSLALAGSAKTEKGFPSNGYAIVSATIALVIIYSFAANTKLARPINALAGLTLLGSVFYYVPILFGTKKKRKNNG